MLTQAQGVEIRLERRARYPLIMHLTFLALVIILQLGVVPVYAQAVPDRAEDGRNKKLSLIHLLVRAGRNDAAADAIRSLYPNGPPHSGDAAVEYYDIVGNTEKGWKEARKGLEKLVKAAPKDVRYRLALARQLTRRNDTRARGMKMFGALAMVQGGDRQKVLEEWRRVLDGMDNSPASIVLYKKYLELDPDNVSVRDALVSAQQAEAKRLPWKMRDKADEQLNAGHADQAMVTLKQALKLDPSNAWVRYDLARLYHKQGDKTQGRSLMEQGLSVAPDDADMLYANAMYVGLLDETENALRLLEIIPVDQRSAAAQRLKHKLMIKMQTQKARAYAHDGKRIKMKEAMEHAEADAGNDAEMVNIVANAWLDMNDPTRGITLMKSLAMRPASSVDARFYYAELLNRAERDDDLAPMLERLSAAKGLSASDKMELRYLKSSLTARGADNLRHEGNNVAARSLLVSSLKNDPENYDLLMALARVHIALKEPLQACDIYRGILRKQDNSSVRLALAGALSDAGDRAGAQREIASVLTNTSLDDVDTRIAIADRYIGIGDIADARAVVEQSRKLAPGNPRVLVQAGLLAKEDGNYREAVDDFIRAKASGEIPYEARSLCWTLRDKADGQLKEGHPEEAIDTLKLALQLDPKNPWVRFDLSRLYHKQGDENRGRDLMAEGLSAAPDDADMLYANALYVNLLDEPENALHLLDRIPASHLSPSMQKLRLKLTMQAHMREVEASAQHAADDKKE